MAILESLVVAMPKHALVHFSGKLSCNVRFSFTFFFFLSFIVIILSHTELNS